MRIINATKFKEQCLELLDRVPNEGILITKRGKPVAKLIPLESDNASLIGSMKGKIAVRGNIRTTGLRWNAQS